MVSAPSHHRLPGAHLDVFGKAGPAGTHLESNRFSPPSAWIVGGFLFVFVCLFACFGGSFYLF